jgi:adenylate kinase
MRTAKSAAPAATRSSKEVRQLRQENAKMTDDIMSMLGSSPDAAKKAMVKKALVRRAVKKALVKKAIKRKAVKRRIVKKAVKRKAVKRRIVKKAVKRKAVKRRAVKRAKKT